MWFGWLLISILAAIGSSGNGSDNDYNPNPQIIDCQSDCIQK